MLAMTVRRFKAYHAEIDRLQAQRDLRAVIVACSPKIESDDRKSLIRDLTRRASGAAREESLIIRPDEAVKPGAIKNFIQSLRS